MKIIIELENPICACGKWENQEDWHWTLHPDEDHWMALRCKKCNTKLLSNCGGRIGYKEPSPAKTTKITRVMTQREAQIFDAVKSELYGIVKHKFEDGFYWVDLCTSHSQEEANLMHHCGKDSRGTIWSLRDEHKIPHLTITVKDDKYVVVLRGRHNKIPNNINKYKDHLDYLYELGLEFNMEEILRGEKED